MKSYVKRISMEERGDWTVLLFLSYLSLGRWRWKMSLSEEGDGFQPIIDRGKVSLKRDWTCSLVQQTGSLTVTMLRCNTF